MIDVPCHNTESYPIVEFVKVVQNQTMEYAMKSLVTANWPLCMFPCVEGILCSRTGSLFEYQTHHLFPMVH